MSEFKDELFGDYGAEMCVDVEGGEAAVGVEVSGSLSDESTFCFLSPDEARKIATMLIRAAFAAEQNAHRIAHERAAAAKE